MKYLSVFAITLSVALLCVGCWDESPGKGATAEKGYAFANPLIEKLEMFHQQQGKYPVSIQEIAPDFEKQKPKEIEFGYKSPDDGKTYEMFFAYYGPGMNVCTYRLAEKQWRCAGAY